MYELTATEYGKVRPLYLSIGYHMALHAVLDGSVQARVFVDDPACPAAALACTRYRFYLAGTPDNEGFNGALRRLFSETIYPAAASSGQPIFILYYAGDEWEDSIKAILASTHPAQYRRQYYLFRTLKQDWRTLLPAGFGVRLTDEGLLTEKHLRYLDRLTEEMCSERASVADFLAHSFGVCVVEGDEAIAAWCLSEYNRGQGCEVGIETADEYRRRGLGTIAASALIEHAAKRGITQIGWDCWAANKPSVATALKAGFEKVHDYPVYFVIAEKDPASSGGGSAKV